jgi:hypothetical protein
MQNSRPEQFNRMQGASIVRLLIRRPRFTLCLCDLCSLVAAAAASIYPGFGQPQHNSQAAWQSV